MSSSAMMVPFITFALAWRNLLSFAACAIMHPFPLMVLERQSY
jgi:hypothetical protein